MDRTRSRKDRPSVGNAENNLTEGEPPKARTVHLGPLLVPAFADWALTIEPSLVRLKTLAVSSARPTPHACLATVQQSAAAPSVHHMNNKQNPMMTESRKQSAPGLRRVLGLDAHPDSFAAAQLEGVNAESAQVLRSTTAQPLSTLETWMLKHTAPKEVVVLEASANSFAIAERLRAIDRVPIILESQRAAKVGQAYLANDRVDAVKLGRLYLSGLARTVWQPDAQTRERRELLSSYRSCIKESTRARQHLRSYLNEHCLRLPVGFRLCRPEALGRLLVLKEWSALQRTLLEEMHTHLVTVRARRQRLRRLMALEIQSDPKLLRLYKLCGLNLVTIYALVAVIGDIERFKSSKSLVNYFGLNPSVDQSGNYEGSTALQRHGRGALRALLIQAAKALLRVENPLQKWGLGVALRRGANRAAVALARKLTVAVWHIMKDHWSAALEVTKTLTTKIFKLATELGVETLQKLGYVSKAEFQEKKLYILQTYP
jgi:transposase